MEEYIFMSRPSFAGYVCYPDFLGGYRQFPAHSVNRDSGTNELNLHQNYNLHLVFGGRGSVYWEGRKYELGRGSGFLFGPGLPQRYEADKQQPWDIRWIHFFGQHLETLLNGRGIGKVWMFTFSDPDRISGLCDELLELGRNYKVEYEAKVSAILYEILLGIQLTSTQVNVPGDSAAEKMQAAANYIRTHCSENIMLEDMAAAAGYSMPYFSRKFRQIMGKKPVDFLLECRILLAKKLLVATELTVKEIAAASGFSQSSYFIRCFRGSERLTPEQFRLSYKPSGSGE